MSANTTISENIRKKLEALAGPDKTADDLANEVLSRYISRREAARELNELSEWGQKQSRERGDKPSDVFQAIDESRRERHER